MGSLKMPQKNCQNCGKVFAKLPTTSKRVWEKQRFCSLGCSGTWVEKGKPLPERLKSAQDKRYLKQREQKQAGVLNHNWKGGISYPFLKTCALVRDNYTCQVCGFSESEIMEIDHIKPKKEFPEFAKDINNLITLCPNCHRRKTNRELKEKGQNVMKQFKVLTNGF